MSNNPLGIQKIHHLEFIVGNAREAEFYYRQALGFDRVAYCGLETGSRGVASYWMRQGDIDFLLTSPLHSNHMASDHLQHHGDGVRDIAFEVEDADVAFAEALKRGARPALAPQSEIDDSGEIRRAAIHSYGDTIHSLISRKNYGGSFLPGFVAQVQHGHEAGLLSVDHIVGNVERGKMQVWCDFYERVLGLTRYLTFDETDIATSRSALSSVVMSDAEHRIKLPINEPAAGKEGKSQIQEYLDYYESAGVQHIALCCDDIVATVRRLKGNGVEFLEADPRYYDALPNWEIDEDWRKLREAGILVDHDSDGYLLQIFTKPMQDRPTVFYEILQRKGCQGFGKGNFKALFVAIEKEQRERGNL